MFNEYRDKIDKIDEKMRNLFIERMKLSCEIGKIKQMNNIPIYDENREKEIISKNVLEVPKHLKDYYLEFYQKIIDLSKEYQNEKICPFGKKHQL